MRNVLMIACLTTLIISGTVLAQSPGSFQYQAVVRGLGGNPLINQPVGMQLSILQGTASGFSVYTETQSSTTNLLGLITISVGGGTVQSGSFSAIDWSAGPYFLKVEIDTSGGSSYVDMGATQLLSVPYAMYSSQSGGGFWDASGDNIYNTNSGKVGVGTNTPPAKMVVQGDSTMADTIPLFEVKDRNGETVFIIYPDSTRLYVGDDGTKTNKGAFAVSGRNTAKQMTNNFLWVTPDSTRVFTGDPESGFGVRNINGGILESYMKLTPKNYFIGHESGYSISTGEYNVFLGYYSGFHNTSGYANTFIGFRAGKSNTTGFNNVFIGDSAGINTTGPSCIGCPWPDGWFGSDNVFIGTNAGKENIVGQQNVYIGSNAGALGNNSGSNVFIGCNAGWYNVNGGNNTYVGFHAGATNLGSSNTVLGSASLWHATSADENVTIGHGAGGEITSGSYNVIIGKNAGRMGNGSNNLFLGRHTGYFNIGSGNVFLGNEVGSANAPTSSSISNRLVIENSNAVPQTGALLYGEFDNDVLRVNGSFGLGITPPVPQWDARYLVVQGNSYPQILTYASNAAVNEKIWRFIGRNDGNAQIQTLDDSYGGEITVIGMMRNGNVGIGTNTPTYKLTVNGTAWCTAGAWASDIRKKKNVEDLNIDGLEIISKLRPVSYEWINPLDEGMKGKQMGFIAQEIEEIIPGIVLTADDDIKTKSIKSNELLPVFVDAIQQQQKQIEMLIRENESLRSEISEIKNNIQIAKK